MSSSKKRLRRIRIIGDIDTENLLKFYDELDLLEQALPFGTAIELELVSEGGSAYDAVAFYGRIKRSSLRIHITAYGMIASAAILVLAAGHKRKMASEATAMVHEDSVSDYAGNTTDMETFSRHMRQLEEQWATLLAGVTKTSAKEWERLHKRTTYLTPKQCLELGLVEEIV